MNMKKTLIFLLIVSLITAFAGCGGNDNKDNGNGAGDGTTSPARQQRSEIQ
jgi:hypothetical protein